MNSLRYILLYILCAICSTTFAQKKATAKQALQMITVISNSAKHIKSMSGSFSQTSELSYLDEPATSTGKMSYASNGDLLWQYTSPFKYTFQVKDGKAYMKSGSHTKTVDLQASKNFKNIASMVQSSITGSNLRNNKDFTVVMYTNGNQWIANMYPRKPQMKKMMKSVSLYYNKVRKVVDRVQMNQVNGDRITIAFSDIKVVAK